MAFASRAAAAHSGIVFPIRVRPGTGGNNDFRGISSNGQKARMKTFAEGKLPSVQTRNEPQKAEGSAEGANG
jgi:hypothetical protein